MTLIDFNEAIKERYPKILTATLSDIREELLDYADEDLELIYDHFRKNYSNVSAPTFGSFYQILKTGNFRKQTRGPQAQYVFLCKKCKTAYAQLNEPLAAMYCPNCLSNDAEVIKKENASKITYVQGQCFTWEEFNDKKSKWNDGNREISLCPNHKQTLGFGPTCQDFGTGIETQECRGCACRMCCKMETKDRNKLKKHKAELNGEKLQDNPFE